MISNDIILKDLRIVNLIPLTSLSRFMGSRSHPHRVLSVCVCVCVSRCLWVCVIEADSLQLRVITVGLYLFLSRSLLCQILAVFAVVVYGPFWFRDSWALLLPGLRSPDLWLPIASLRYPRLPYGELRFCLRKAPPLPYGKLRFCLRKAPPLPYGKLRFCLRKAPPLPYGKLRFCLRKAPPLSTKSSTFSSRCVLLLVINSLFRNWILPSSLWQKDLTIFMDSAETRGLQELISGNNARMDLQEENMLNTGRAVQALVAQVSELTTQVQLLRSPAAPPTPPSFSIPGNHSPQHEPRLPAPEKYAGDPNLCRAFLTKCSLFFSLQPLTFATEVSRVALVLTLLSGKAALWGTAVWENRHPCCSSFHSLSQEMRRVFDRALVGREAARRLADLRQGEQSVSDYSIQFRTLAAECEWNGKAQWDMFLHGLADRIHQEIDVVELPLGLDELVDLALRVDARLQQRDLRGRRKLTPRHSFFDTGNTVGHSSVDEPMQVGRARLSREERDRRRMRGLCLYCGAAGHFLASCPVKDQARQ